MHHRRLLSGLALYLLAAGCSDPSSPGEEETFRAASIVSGYSFSCALDEEGAAWCWGRNDEGQLGRGTTSANESFGPVSGGVQFETLAAADRNVCGLSGGAVWCWGSGILLGSEEPLRSPTVVGPGTVSFVALTLGGGHACALAADHVAYCWGDNDILGGGQLGDGTSTSRSVATAVTGGHLFDELSAGFVHTCGRSGSEIWCWGANYENALGATGISGSLTPRLVDTAPSAHSLRTGSGFTCVGATTTLHCWGTNLSGQLGIGSTDRNRIAATELSTQATLSDVSMAGVNRISTHACALDGTGQSYCWGANDHGQLGRTTNDGCDLRNGGPPIQCALAPGIVATALRFAAIAPGATHTCAITDGDIYCWGSGDAGELGGGPRSDTRNPVLVVTSAES